ncbi:unnamed protein product [Sphagnum tenellum]
MASCTCRCGNHLGDSADVLEASGGTRETAAQIDSKLSTITNASSDHDASCIDRVAVKHLPRSCLYANRQFRVDFWKACYTFSSFMHHVDK